jgi:hypothetical protein
MDTLLQQLKLNQRFPNVDFTTAPYRDDDGTVVIPVTWQFGPSAMTVAEHIRAHGLPVKIKGEHILEIRLPASAVKNARPGASSQGSPPHSKGSGKGNPSRPSGRPDEPRPRYRRTPPPRPQQNAGVRSFGAQGLWSISDLEIIRTISSRWASSLQSRTVVMYYAVGMALLTLATGYMAWALDIHPSLVFGRHLADELLDTNTWLNPNVLATVIFLLSITPNLLEFFASGLAVFGNVIVDIAIKAALAFDAATDSPAAYAIAEGTVNFFTQEQSGFLYHTMVVLVSIPVLFFNTVVVEILFLSFLTTTVLLFIRYFQLPKHA